MAPSREAALMSPYYEQFKSSDVEVLFLYQTIDDFVMRNVNAFNGRNLVGAETSSVDLNKKDGGEEKDKEGEEASVKRRGRCQGWCDWLTTALSRPV